MKMTALVLLVVLLLFLQGPAGAAESNSQAKKEYFSAEEAAKMGDHDEAIRRLDQVIKLLGSTNTRVQFLLSMVCVAKKDFARAKKEIDRYFEVTPASRSGLDGYKEMVALRTRIDSGLSQTEKESHIAPRAPVPIEKQPPDQVMSLLNQAIATKNAGKVKKSLEIFSQIKPGETDEIRADSKLMSLLKQAVELFDRPVQSLSLSLNDSLYGTYKIALGELFFLLGDYHKAEYQFYAAIQFVDSLSVESNSRIEWRRSKIRELAESGHSEAEAAYAHFLTWGKARDHKTGAIWYKKAAEKGNINAQREFGRWFELGLMVGVDEKEAAKWFRMAADQGDAYSIKTLAGYHFRGVGGCPKDPQEGLRLVRRAAELGNSDAAFNLACFYESGYGLPVNKAEARKWAQRAADLGNPAAIEMLKSGSK